MHMQRIAAPRAERRSEEGGVRYGDITDLDIRHGLSKLRVVAQLLKFFHVSNFRPGKRTVACSSEMQTFLGRRIASYPSFHHQS